MNPSQNKKLYVDGDGNDADTARRSKKEEDDEYRP